jgi:hypothetical protein
MGRSIEKKIMIKPKVQMRRYHPGNKENRYEDTPGFRFCLASGSFVEMNLWVHFYLWFI